MSERVLAAGGLPAPRPGLLKRSFTLTGHRTSVALEPAFWDALAAIGATQGKTVLELIVQVDAARDPKQNLASALRLFTLQHAHF